MIHRLHPFFIRKTFINNTRLKLAKNQAKASQHPEAELLSFENYFDYLINDIISLIIMKIKMKMEYRSYRYDINRSKSRHGIKYTKYKKCLSMIMLICIKQHLSNIS